MDRWAAKTGLLALLTVFTTLFGPGTANAAMDRPPTTAAAAPAGTAGTDRSAAPGSGPVVVIGVPGLLWSDLDVAATPHLWRLVAAGGAASLSTRAIPPPETGITCPAAGWLTVSAGQRAGSPGDGCAMPTPPAGTDEVTVPGWADLVAFNSASAYRAELGLLGQAVRDAGGKVAAVGPGAALAAADKSGKIAKYADNPSQLADWSAYRLIVVEANQLAATWLGDAPGAGGTPGDPAGAARRAAVAAADAVVAETLAQLPAGATILVAGVSDTTAAAHLHVAIAVAPRTASAPVPGQNGAHQDLRPEQEAAQEPRRAGASEASERDDASQRSGPGNTQEPAQNNAAQGTGRDGASQEPERGNTQEPARNDTAQGSGRDGASQESGQDRTYRPGFLTAASTRQDGLVTLTDLTATVLDALGLPAPAGVVGRPWTAGSTGPAQVADRVAHLADADLAGQVLREVRAPFFGALVAVQLLFYALAALTIRRYRRMLTVTQVVAVVSGAVPVATFLAQLVPWWALPYPMAALVGTILGFALLITGAAFAGPWRGRVLGPLTVVAAVTALTLLADVATGSRLQVNAVTGYEPITGGRFYGFSNIAFAVYATGTLLALAGLAHRLRTRRTSPAESLDRTAAAGTAERSDRRRAPAVTDEPEPARPAGRPHAREAVAATDRAPGTGATETAEPRHDSEPGQPIGRPHTSEPMATADRAPGTESAGTAGGPEAARSAGQRYGRMTLPLCLLGGLVAIFADGWPGWGADFGGVPAFVLGLAVFLLLLSGRKVSPVRLAAVAAAGAALIGVIAFVDLLRPADRRTHLGTFAQQVLDGAAWTVVGRKLSAMLGTLGNLPLTALSVVALAFLFGVLARPSRWGAAALGRAYDRAPALRAGLLGALSCAVAAFLINDSGIAIPAMALTVAVPLTVAASVRALQLDAPTTPAPPSAPAASTARSAP